MSYGNKSYENDDPQAEKYRQLFLGGLNKMSTDETIKQHFGQWGEIIKCVIPKMADETKSRGFGFITYKTAEMLDDAQNNRPHKIDNREIDTKRATSRNQPNENRISVKKMFVGGLKGDTTEDDIREVFGRYGKIEKLDIIKDKDTGKQKGFCFVTFDDFDSVDKCVLRRRILVGDKYVEVKKAVPKDQRSDMGDGHNSFRNGMRDDGGFGGGSNNGYYHQENNGYFGNQGGGFGSCGGYEGSGDWYQGDYNSGMGGWNGNNFNDGYNNGYGYGSGYSGGPIRSAGFSHRGAAPYNNGRGGGGMGNGYGR